MRTIILTILMALSINLVHADYNRSDYVKTNYVKSDVYVGMTKDEMIATIGIPAVMPHRIPSGFAMKNTWYVFVYDGFNVVTQHGKIKRID